MMDYAITSFTGVYRFLSNFWMCEVPYNGLVYPSAEHAYQAAKTSDPDLKAKFVRLKTPGAARRLGQTVNMPATFMVERTAIMDAILAAKFNTNRDLAARLLATRPKFLVEGNDWHDVYWGVSEGYGLNWLGHLLMVRREELYTWGRPQ